MAHYQYEQILGNSFIYEDLGSIAYYEQAKNLPKQKFHAVLRELRLKDKPLRPNLKLEYGGSY